MNACMNNMVGVVDDPRDFGCGELGGGDVMSSAWLTVSRRGILRPPSRLH